VPGRITGHGATAMAPFRHSTTASISSSVVPRPRLKRIAPMPTSSATPIASSAGDSSTRPAWHAEPVEAATPSNRSSTSTPTCSMKETLSVFGRRCAGCPLRAMRSPNRSCSSRQKWSRRTRTRSIGARSHASSQAFPNEAGVARDYVLCPPWMAPLFASISSLGSSGPRPTAPAGPSRRGYPAGGNGRLELYPARRVLVFRRGLFYLRSLAPGIFCGEPRVRRGKELSRDGAHYQGR